MELIQIEPVDFATKIFHLWDKKWFLLTSGDFGKSDYNTMTIAWGSFGVMWNKPFVQVVVRPTRFTYNFTERYDSFTLTAFPGKYSKALSLLGTKSGREGDKIKEAGLTPQKSTLVSSPSFEEAELIIECQKIYWDDFKPENFIDKQIDKNYPEKDYHRVYYGQILSIIGTKDYTI